jgi:hypothetical protein
VINLVFEILQRLSFVFSIVLLFFSVASWAGSFYQFIIFIRKFIIFFSVQDSYHKINIKDSMQYNLFFSVICGALGFLFTFFTFFIWNQIGVGH